MDAQVSKCTTGNHTYTWALSAENIINNTIKQNYTEVKFLNIKVINGSKIIH
jgi:hypothetical protein